LLLVIRFYQFDKSDFRLRFCFWTTLLFVGAVLLISCFKKVQGNWAVGAYPTAFVILCASSRLGWVKIGSFVSLALVVFVFCCPNYRQNPLKQALGWQSIPEILQEVSYD